MTCVRVLKMIMPSLLVPLPCAHVGANLLCTAAVVRTPLMRYRNNTLMRYRNNTPAGLN